MYMERKNNLPMSVNFHQDTYFKIKVAIDQYLKDDDIDALTINLLQLWKNITAHEVRSIKAIIYLLPELSDIDMKHISEAHVTTSYIHPIIRSIFSNPSCISHCSNLNATDNKRPDYEVDVYDYYYYLYTKVFGEVKGNQQSWNDRLLTKDFYRLCMFGKDSIDKNNLTATIIFQAIGTSITFYLIQLSYKKTYIIFELTAIRIPTKKDDLPIMLLALDYLTNLSIYHELLCTKTSTNNFFSYKHPTLPWNIVEDTIGKSKSKKRRASINFHK
ncbi:unnamed protein product [Cunninghamella echinulata]